MTQIDAFAFDRNRAVCLGSSKPTWGYPEYGSHSARFSRSIQRSETGEMFLITVEEAAVCGISILWRSHERANRLTGARKETSRAISSDEASKLLQAWDASK